MSTEIAGYRFKDLKAARIVSSRSDLNRKQVLFGFPRPVKLAARAAWWPASVQSEQTSRRRPSAAHFGGQRRLTMANTS